MKIIGVGLPRTGTWSLKLAFEQLGFGPCYHMSEAFGDEANWPQWIGAAKGESVEWSKIFGRWGSTTDAPGCVFWQQLANYYPAAKLVLTERDPQKWYASTQATILRLENHAAIGSIQSGMMEMIKAVGWSPMDPDNHHEDIMLKRFHSHNTALKAAFGPERLLVFEVAQGWEPLCRFLGVPVPTTPFPKVNSTEDFLQMVAARKGPTGAH